MHALRRRLRPESRSHVIAAVISQLPGGPLKQQERTTPQAVESPANAAAPTWWHKAVALAWIAAIVLGIVHISRPAPDPPAPPGWTIWRTPGPTRAVVLAGDGVFAGGLYGLFRLGDDGSAARVDVPGVKRPFVNAMMLDGQDRLWVAHDGGVSVRSSAGWTTLTTEQGLPHDYVSAVVETSDGSIWLGTMRGAVRLPAHGPWGRDAMKVTTTEDGLIHSKVWAIAEDSERGMWFGTYAAPEGGLSRLSEGRWTQWIVADGLPHANVTSLLVTRGGVVWVGCGIYDEGGAATLDNHSDGWRLARTVPAEELAGPKVRSLCEDRDGRIWVGSEYDGLAVRRSGATLRILTPDDGLPAWEVMSVTEADDGAIWLGTGDGVVRLSPEALAALFVP